VAQETRTPASTVPFSDALLEVVKGLKDDTVLLFGIGAGILLVAVLAFTSSLSIVIVVAAVLVLVLGASVVTRTRAAQSGKGPVGRRLVANLKSARVLDSDVQTVDTATGSIDAELNAEGAVFDGSRAEARVDPRAAAAADGDVFVVVAQPPDRLVAELAGGLCKLL